MLLSEYDIQYVTQKAIKRSVLFEYLSHHPVNDYQPMKFDFSEEDVMALKDYDILGPKEGPKLGSCWKLVFDGASNALGHGVGEIITSLACDHTPFNAILFFDCTNNMAEYEACILGLEASTELRIKILEIYGDLALVICQINGKWETRHPNLIPCRDYVKTLIISMKSPSITFLERRINLSMLLPL